MKKLLFTLLFALSFGYSQMDIGRENNGFRVPGAFTLPQGFLFVSGAYQTVSDGKPIAIDGSTNQLTGAKINLGNDIPSSGGNVHLAFGIFDFIEIHAGLPFYFDGEIAETELEGIGLGDLELSLKGALPFDFPLHAAAEIYFSSPTGTKSKGFRPRHSWFINSHAPSYAFTADDLHLGFNLFLSLDLLSILHWNNYSGLSYGAKAGIKVFKWGSGLEILPQKLISLGVEISGEYAFETLHDKRRLLESPILLTGGLKLHLPRSFDILFGVDIGLDMFKKDNSQKYFDVIRKSGNATIRYSVAPSPEMGFFLGITKSFDFSWKDGDRDGIVDRLDMCPNTDWGVIVNNRGCPVDTDQDGVLNIVDNCPDTPYGIEVDFSGCPLDADNDGVPDYLDKCPNTALGVAVDGEGCFLDSDNDGVDDNNDFCPNSKPGEKVGANGCPVDEDGDGVPNEKDKCPNTPENWAVDNDGCPLDFDSDGVPNEIDMCPNSQKDELIDSTGCPVDSDNDGVADTKDKCPLTPENISVDEFGCPLDEDGDGIPDDLDKCRRTPHNAPVDTLGCPLDSDNDGVFDYLDECPYTFEKIHVKNDGCPIEPKYNLNAIAKNIRFKANNETLLNASYTALNDAIELLRRYPFKLEVQCSNQDAETLATARCESIRTFFESKGFEEERIIIQSFGKKLPQNEEYKKLNNSGIRLVPRSLD